MCCWNFNKCLAEFEDLEQLNVVLEVKAGSLDRMNDACSRFQGNEECCHSGMGMILMSARLRIHICSQVLDLNLFFFSVISQSKVFFFSNPLVYCAFQMGGYISSAPLLLSDGWIRGDQKGGDRERVSAAFTSSLFSPHSANAVPSNCMTCPGFSFSLPL